jgi:hypothetical protein
LHIPLHKDSQRQPNEQNVLQDEFDAQPQWWSWQRRRGAERQNDKVHYNENAKPIQDRARDDMATQERNSVNAENENASHNRNHHEIKDQSKQGSGESACKGGLTHYAAGYKLQLVNHWSLKDQPKNDSLLDQKMEKTRDNATDHT